MSICLTCEEKPATHSGSLSKGGTRYTLSKTLKRGLGLCQPCAKARGLRIIGEREALIVALRAEWDREPRIVLNGYAGPWALSHWAESHLASPEKRQAAWIAERKTQADAQYRHWKNAIAAVQAS